MHIISDPPLTPAWLVTKIHSPELVGAFIVKGTFTLRRGTTAEPHPKPLPATGDEHHEDDEGKSLRYASDFAPFKPFADIVLKGSCHAPGGNATGACRVTFRVAGWFKTLAVIGDRVRLPNLLGFTDADPIPFTRIPITYENAFGGPDYPANPYGKGAEDLRSEGGTRYRLLPNIVEPSDALTNPLVGGLTPAGFGPLPTTAPLRKSKAGTYGQKWLKERWPWLPEDFDWSYFNAAPKDQQLPDPLRGDEELRVENLHPTYSDYSARLPGIRVRCFLHERRGEAWQFREVPLRLDTLWVDMDAELLVLVWRGHVPVHSPKMKELQHLYVASEPLANSPASPEEHRLRLNRLLPDRFKFLSASPEPPAPHPPPPTEGKSIETESAEASKELAGLEAQAVQRVQEAARALANAGQLLPSPTAPPLDFAAAKKQIETMGNPVMAELRRTLGPASKFPENIEVPVPPEAAQLGDPSGAAMWTRESLIAAVVEKKDFSGQDFRKLDLSGLLLSNAILRNARFDEANLSKAGLAGADLSGASFRRANLSEADLSGAQLDDTNFTQANLTKANGVGASVRHADFSQSDVSEADFSRAIGKGFSLQAAKALKFRACGAKLPSANFQEAMLDGADFSSAVLPGARYAGSQAKGILLEGVDAERLHAGGAPDFTGARCSRLRGPHSTWDGAKLDGALFSEAVLTRADFTDASLNRAEFLRCEMRKVRFQDATLRQARIVQSNVCDGLFERADLTGADLVGSNFYNAEFWKAKTEGVKRLGANFNGTKLA